MLDDATHNMGHWWENFPVYKDIGANFFEDTPTSKWKDLVGDLPKYAPRVCSNLLTFHVLYDMFIDVTPNKHGLMSFCHCSFQYLFKYSTRIASLEAPFPMRFWGFLHQPPNKNEHSSPAKFTIPIKIRSHSPWKLFQFPSFEKWAVFSTWASCYGFALGHRNPPTWLFKNV